MSVRFDELRPWAIGPAVSLRREPFGALAYDFDSRRLSFLKHPVLVSVVEGLASAPSALAACEAAGVGERLRPAIVRGLAGLAERGMIVERMR
jgi:putative mycofactocin binding protein MftB